MALQGLAGLARMVTGPTCGGAITTAALAFPYLAGAPLYSPLIAKANVHTTFSHYPILQYVALSNSLDGGQHHSTFSSATKGHTYAYKDLPLKSVNEALTLLMAFHPWVTGVLEAEEAALDTGEVPVYPPIPPIVPALNRGLYSSGREICTKVVRINMQHKLAAQVAAETAYRYIADMPTQLKQQTILLANQSILTKLARYYRTTWEAYALGALADCAVSLLEVTYAVLRGKRSTLHRLQHWVVSAACQVTRCLVSLGASAAGATLGTLLASAGRAHWGAFFVELLVSSAFMVFVLQGIEAQYIPPEDPPEEPEPEDDHVGLPEDPAPEMMGR